MKTNTYGSELFIIVSAQFFCTSVWFASNAIAPEIIQALDFPPSALAHMTSAVQFGFICGTLLFSILAIADRLKPSIVFMVCALLAATLNVSVVFAADLRFLLTCRFLTGFFLAGIYPVGMKIASDFFEKGLGKSLGLLVGALVFGTALPHLFRALATDLIWKYVIYITSGLAAAGGLCLYLLVGNGPYRKVSGSIRLSSFLDGFKSKDFRAAAFGYFGHMWELYAFWAFVPVIWRWYAEANPNEIINVSWLSFLVIGSGGLACVLSGSLSAKFPARLVAMVALLISCACCLLAHWMLQSSFYFMVGFMVVWGLSVVADSPMFSSLVAQHAPPESRGTAIAIVTCIGFSVTILSIQILNVLSQEFSSNFIYSALAIGPILGLYAMTRRG